MARVTNKALDSRAEEHNPDSWQWKKWIANLRDQFPVIKSYQPSLNPTSIAANTVEDQTFTVTGLVLARDVVIGCTPPQLTAGLVVHQVRVSADDTLQIRLQNTTGAPIDEAAATWYIITMGY